MIHTPYILNDLRYGYLLRCYILRSPVCLPRHVAFALLFAHGFTIFGCTRSDCVFLVPHICGWVYPVPFVTFVPVVNVTDMTTRRLAVTRWHLPFCLERLRVYTLVTVTLPVFWFGFFTHTLHTLRRPTRPLHAPHAVTTALNYIYLLRFSHLHDCGYRLLGLRLLPYTR